MNNNEITEQQIEEVIDVVEKVIMKMTSFQQRMIIIEIMNRVKFQDSKITW